MTDLSLSRRSRVGVWVQAARPRTLTIALAPVLVGGAHAAAYFGRIALAPVLAAALSALAIQIVANLANDAADGARGLDGPGRLGPQRVTGAGLMSATQVRAGALVATAAAALFGLVAIAYGGALILAIGLAALTAGWAYSHGPAPISASPFGEIFVVLFFGIAAVAGVEYLAAGFVSPQALALGCAIGLPAAGVLTVNNHRDRAIDSANGRRTLAILLGPGATRTLYGAELLIAVALAAMVVGERHAASGALVATMAVPALYLSVRLARTPVDVALNARLGATALFQLALAGAVALGLALA